MPNYKFFYYVCVNGNEIDWWTASEKEETAITLLRRDQPDIYNLLLEDFGNDESIPIDHFISFATLEDLNKSIEQNHQGLFPPEKEDKIVDNKGRSWHLKPIDVDECIKL